MLNSLLKYIPWIKIKILEKENKDLKEKLIERQEIINKTNAYWKKKLYDVQKKAKSKNTESL